MRSNENWAVRARHEFKTDFFASEVGEESTILGFAVLDQLVRGFSFSSEASVLQFSTEPADPARNTEVLFTQWPEMTFVEAAGLVSSPEFSRYFDETLFFEKLRQGRSVLLTRLAQVVVKLPQGFKTWLRVRQVKASELSALTSVDSAGGVFEFLKSSEVENFLGRENPSKSEGVQILEWIVDLLLIHPDQTGQMAQVLCENLDQVQRQLREWRYPQTTSQDLEREEIQLSWPSSIQNKFLRRGDRSGFDLRVFVSHPSELRKVIQGFERVLEEWNNPSPKV